MQSMELYARDVLPRPQAEDTFRDIGYEVATAAA